MFQYDYISFYFLYFGVNTFCFFPHTIIVIIMITIPIMIIITKIIKIVIIVL